MDPDPISEFRDSLSHIGKQTLILLVGFFFVFIGWGAVALAIREIVTFATKLHWLIGLAAAMALFFAFLWVLRWVRNAPLTSLNFGQYPRIGLALNLVFIAASAMIVMAMISDVLYQQNLVHYVSDRRITLDLLFDFYGWHLIDAIPVFNVWSIFDIEAPARSEGVLANLLLQVFLVLVIASSLEIFRGKRGDFGMLLASAKRLREDEKLEKARRHLDQAASLAMREGNRLHQIDAYVERVRLLMESGDNVTAGEFLEKVEKLIDLESRDRDLDARRRAVQQLRAKPDQM